MKSKAKFKSDAFEAIHSAAQGLHRAGTLDKATMREFDESCLTAPSVIAPAEIKRIREGRKRRTFTKHRAIHRFSARRYSRAWRKDGG